MIAVHKVREKGGKVSFDPNIRKEMLCAPGMRGAMLNILKCCDLFLPSGNELVALTDATDEDGAIEEIFRLGVLEVILKKGSEGCVFFSREQRIAVPAFPVAEIDPTGAGDCFGATYCCLPSSRQVCRNMPALCFRQRGPGRIRAWTDGRKR